MQIQTDKQTDRQTDKAAHALVSHMTQSPQFKNHQITFNLQQLHLL